MKTLLSGNEAVARGAYECGVRIAAAYPGTPSTEILENISRYKEIYAEWAPNEKVAMEVAIGGSMAGARAIVCMKHVGLNVAADPFMTFAYTGGYGGLVVACADDPGMHSSQNEQDSRYFARMALVPMLEPSSSQEAKDFVGLGMELAEKFDTPVLLRLSTRISHAGGVVELGERRDYIPTGFKKDPQKFVMLPANARLRHPRVLERLELVTEWAETYPGNFVEWVDTNIGIISSGVAYQYAKEVMPRASFLKLGLPYPLPAELVKSFAGKVKRLFVVEELEPFLEEQIRALGIEVEGKKYFPRQGELTPDLVEEGFLRALKSNQSYACPAEVLEDEEELPALPRPPILCPGCPHRGIFYLMHRMDIIVTGDIGCYTLAALPPLGSMDSCICMGASIGNALGLSKALEHSDKKKPVVAVIGDSTFLHSGITGLLDVVYNKGNVTVVILDNRTTAMTGGQDHPGTGKTAMGEHTQRVDLINLCRALGVERIRPVNCYALEEIKKILEEELAAQEPSVIITQGPCTLLDKSCWQTPVEVDIELCNGCKACFQLGCPSIGSITVEEIDLKEDGRRKKVLKAVIDATTCTGCYLCVQVCKYEAIKIKES
jgi:indolepyruvate ferredoxin oxidoreductase alpha subunit